MPSALSCRAPCMGVKEGQGTQGLTAEDRDEIRRVMAEENIVVLGDDELVRTRTRSRSLT
jgi:hypothetical protein